MNAAKIVRELKALDDLETRVKELVNPNPQMLEEIRKAKAGILDNTKPPLVKK